MKHRRKPFNRRPLPPKFSGGLYEKWAHDLTPLVQQIEISLSPEKAFSQAMDTLAQFNEAAWWRLADMMGQSTVAGAQARMRESVALDPCLGLAIAQKISVLDPAGANGEVSIPQTAFSG